MLLHALDTAKHDPVGSPNPTDHIARAFGFAVSLVVFCPLLIAPLMPPRVILIGLLILFCMWFLVTRGREWRASGPLLALLLMFIALIGTLVGFGLLPTTGAETGNAQRFMALLPLALLAGYISSRPGGRQFWQGFLAVAALLVIPAIYEFVTSQSLLGRNMMYFVENGRPRALLASDHPLVLGTLFLAAIPLSARINGGKAGLLLAIWLFVGVITTGSEGPIALGLVCLLAVMAPRVATLVAQRRALLIWLAFIALAVTAYLSIFVWNNRVLGATSGEYSRGYRASLYSMVPRMLWESPLGNGFAGLPSGRWLIDSQYKGTRDISISIDSEVVYLISIIGIAGLLVYLLALLLAISALRHHLPLALSACCVAVSGVVLALTVWDTVAVVWWMLIGACLGFVVQRSPLEPHRGHRQSR